VNCFDGSKSVLEEFLGLGKNIYIVITGLICSDDRGSHLRDIIKLIPLDKLLIASDSPHLTPYNMPRPYPRRNEPGFTSHLLVFIAEVLGIDFEKLSLQTTQNARKVFGLPELFYSGITTKAEILTQEIQKEEDNKFKKPPKVKEVKPNIIKLEGDQHVFSLKKEDETEVAWIVSTKEKQIMEKQLSQKKSNEEIISLASTIELKEIGSNSLVQRGEETVYSNVPIQK
jgi:hypothetical protein